MVCLDLQHSKVFYSKAQIDLGQKEPNMHPCKFNIFHLECCDSISDQILLQIVDFTETTHYQQAYCRPLKEAEGVYSTLRKAK